MQAREILILLLEDGPPLAVINTIDCALHPMATQSNLSKSHGEWTIRLAGTDVTVRVDVRKSLQTVREMFQPRTDAASDVDRFDLVLLDNAWEEADGYLDEGIRQLKEHGWRDPTRPLLAIYTGHATFNPGYVGDAFDAGACALVKKDEPVHFVNLMHFAAKHKEWRRSLVRSQHEVSAILNEPKWSSRLVAESESMRSTLRAIVSAASLDHLPVVLEGSIGTGKTLLAELIHSLSPRAKGPYVSAYLNQYPTELVSGELYGIARGAATGVAPRKGLVAAAEGGTLFLDELQTLSLEHQEILKNVIERKRYFRAGEDGIEHPCDVRFVFATNEPIEQLVSGNRMRRDFARRIDLAKISIPDLSDRIEDIPRLAETAIRRWYVDVRHNGEPPQVTDEIIKTLSTMSFPDNVDGLFKCIWRGCMQIGQDGILKREYLQKPSSASISRLVFSSADYMELARIGPRDRTSQRLMFDALVAAAPEVVRDEVLISTCATDRAMMHTVISRLRRRLAQSTYSIARDEMKQGYCLVKELV